MGEAKKKPGRSRKNGTDWELRRYVMLLAAVIVLILIGAVADQVLFMADGVIAESGTPEELFNHPKSPALQAFLSKAQNK